MEIIKKKVFFLRTLCKKEMLTYHLVNSIKLAQRYPGLFARDEAERRLHFAVRYSWYWHTYRKYYRNRRETWRKNATGPTKNPANTHDKSVKNLIPSIGRVRAVNSDVVSITY